MLNYSADTKVNQHELTNKNDLILYKGLIFFENKKGSNQVITTFNYQWVARGSNPGPTD